VHLLETFIRNLKKNVLKCQVDLLLGCDIAEFKRHLNVEVAISTDILADIFVKVKTRCYAQKMLFISALGTSDFIKLSDSME
jgi:hypothetical protein